MEPHPSTVFESIADAVPTATALVQGRVRRSWREFDDNAARLAGAFQAAGLTAGSKVAEYLYNSPEYLETFHAALKIRAVPVNINYRYLDDELLYLLENSDAEALVFHSSLSDRVGRVQERATGLKLLVEVDDGGEHLHPAVPYGELLSRSDPAPRIERNASDITMIYTGGTTGMPKGVMTPVGLAVESIMDSTPALVGLPPVTDPAHLAPLVDQLARDERLMAALPACPLMHATGLSIGAMPSLIFGGSVVLLEGPGLDTDEVWSTVEREKVTALTIVGDAFARPLLRQLDDGPARDLSSLLVICSSGAMFSAEVKMGLLRHIPQLLILDFIAATEGAMGVAIASKDSPPVTGRFLPGPGVKVFDEHDREVTAGSDRTGVVAIPGAIPEGYYKDPAKTALTFREIDGVRYSVPGDWASVDADGSITLLGRGSQCINTGGEKVYPEEVEEAIKRHPAVEDCLVFGLADERFGQRVVGVVSLQADAEASEDELLADLRTRLSTYKVPRQLRLVSEAPRAPNGKADYPRARQLFAADEDAG